jgi:hypothetical protein
VTDAPAYERVVAIASCGSRWEADLKWSVLDAEGYRVTVASDDAGGLHPELAFLVCAYRLMVPETEAASARELLDAIEEHSAQEQGSVAPVRASRGWWVAIAVLVAAVLAYRIWYLAAAG